MYKRFRKGPATWSDTQYAYHCGGLWNMAPQEYMVKQYSGCEQGVGIGKVWWSMMPEILCGVLRMLIYFIPFWNDCCCTEYYWKVLCNFWSVGEVHVCLCVCSSVYVGQLLLFYIWQAVWANSLRVLLSGVGLAIRKAIIPWGGRQQAFYYRGISLCHYIW